LSSGLAKLRFVYRSKKTRHSGVMKLKAHIFVCTNERPEGHPRGCCRSKDSEAILQNFKQELSKHGLAKQVRAQKAGCLDRCELGPSVVVYPEGFWYGKLSPQDVSEIVQSHIIEGNPVQRLQLQDE
jgi:(2Fe-2S) ferredoxin